MGHGHVFIIGYTQTIYLVSIKNVETRDLKEKVGVDLVYDVC